MYPYVRLVKEVFLASRMPKMGPFDLHVTHHLCWPWDIDPWRELNNGRTLTLYDLGRMPMGIRMGLPAILKRNRWGLAVAGASVRYRARVKMFDRIEMRTRCLGWDARFVYMDQSMWRGDTCTSQALIRSAITSANGIVPPAELATALGGVQSPALPDWVQAWAAADATRPWPPA